MKRETLNHPKIHDLASRLGITRAQALGHLALLWNWTADFAIDGNIGKWPNGSFAGPCDWRGDPDEFVTALVESGWVDRDPDPDHRLVIHDWAQHCENWVRAKAEKVGVTLLGQKFRPTYEPDLRAGLKSGSDPDPSTDLKSGSEPDSSPDLKSGSFPRDQTKPILSKPNQAKTEEESAPCRADSHADSQPAESTSKGKSRTFDPEFASIPETLRENPRFSAAWRAWIAHRREKKKPLTETQTAVLLPKLAEWGSQRAIAAIYHTIAQGWIGIREPEPERQPSNGNDAHASLGRFVGGAR